MHKNCSVNKSVVSVIRKLLIIFMTCTVQLATNLFIATDMGPVDPAKSLTAMSPSGISFLPQILMNTSNGADRKSNRY